MSIELTHCPSCGLFVSMRGYDHHIMRCGTDMCRTCDGKGEIADYVGLEMKCVGVECHACNGSGRAALSSQPEVGKT